MTEPRASASGPRWMGILRAVGERRLLTRTVLLRRTGKADDETRTSPEFALHRHLAAHLLDGVADDGEAESGSAGLARTRLIGPVEALENAWNVLRCDTDAGVGDGHD